MQPGTDEVGCRKIIPECHKASQTPSRNHQGVGGTAVNSKPESGFMGQGRDRL